MGVEERFEDSEVELATEEERKIADAAISAWQAWEEMRGSRQQVSSTFNQDGSVVKITIEHEAS
jgi:hypothetical protein